MTAHGQLPPRGLVFTSPTAVARDSTNAIVGRLPSPLVPCPHYPVSAAGISASSHSSQQQAFASNPVINGGIHAKHLPVYFMPQSHGHVIPRQPAGYVVPVCKPAFTPSPANFQSAGGLFCNDVNGNQPVGMFRPNHPTLGPLRNTFPPLQASSILSAPSGIIPPSVYHSSNGGTNVPWTAVTATSTVQPRVDALPGVCMALNGMALNEKEFSILQDAIKDEQAALGVSQSLPVVANQFSPSRSGGYIVTSTRSAVETSSAESDCSLSDWSIIDLPSPPSTSSLSQDETTHGIPAIASSASPSLMQFSPDSGARTVTSNPVCSGPLHRQFEAQKLSAACIPLPGSVHVSVGIVYTLFHCRLRGFDCLLHSLQAAMHLYPYYTGWPKLNDTDFHFCL